MSTPVEPCNVAAALAFEARQQPGAPAIHFPTGKRGRDVRYEAISYGDLDTLSDTFARGLHEFGLGRGSRVALMVPPGVEFFALFFALFKAGIAPMLIDPGIGIRALRSCLDEARPHGFIGVSRAQAARKLLGWAPREDAMCITLGPRLAWGGIRLTDLERLGARTSGTIMAPSLPGEMAAILFTSGSTGPPKGVVYRHRHFSAQVALLRDTFGIERGEVDLATFPPFALFDPALGMTTIVPWMDPTRPARADPELLTRAIERFGVTNIFASPALLRVLARHAHRKGVTLVGVRRILSAGAAVPGAVVRDMQAALPTHARVHTPYGATECLPVASVSSRELDDRMMARTDSGAGICVGMPVKPNRIAIIPVTDEPIERLEETRLLDAGETGEIIVHGPTTTDAYWRREAQTRLAKLTDCQGDVWHRMGDIGYVDEKGRLWYCGRKSQRVTTASGTLFPDQVEAVFNAHSAVARSALVGIGEPPDQKAVLCVEPAHGVKRRERRRIRAELLELAADSHDTREVRDVLFHRGFPVDIRHNSKIDREAIARWARRKLA